MIYLSRSERISVRFLHQNIALNLKSYQEASAVFFHRTQTDLYFLVQDSNQLWYVSLKDAQARSLKFLFKSFRLHSTKVPTTEDTSTSFMVADLDAMALTAKGNNPILRWSCATQVLKFILLSTTKFFSRCLPVHQPAPTALLSKLMERSIAQTSTTLRYPQELSQPFPLFPLQTAIQSWKQLSTSAAIILETICRTWKYFYSLLSGRNINWRYFPSTIPSSNVAFLEVFQDSIELGLISLMELEMQQTLLSELTFSHTFSGLTQWAQMRAVYLATLCWRLRAKISWLVRARLM